MTAKPDVRPVVLVGDTRRGRFESHCAASVEVWLQTWWGTRNRVDGIEPSQVEWREGFGQSWCFRIEPFPDPFTVRVDDLLWSVMAGLDAVPRSAGRAVERTIAAELQQRAVRSLVALLAEADESAVTVEPSAGGVALGTPIARHCAATLALRAGAQVVSLAVRVPCQFLLAICPRSAASPLPDARGALVDQIGPEMVEVAASMGPARISVSGLVGLAPGDVIVLEQRLADPAQLAIPGYEPFLQGFIGVSAGRRAVSIDSVLSTTGGAAAPRSTAVPASRAISA
jgi:hypothetical protein